MKATKGHHQAHHVVLGEREHHQQPGGRPQEVNQPQVRVPHVRPLRGL